MARHPRIKNDFDVPAAQQALFGNDVHSKHLVTDLWTHVRNLPGKFNAATYTGSSLAHAHAFLVELERLGIRNNALVEMYNRHNGNLEETAREIVNLIEYSPAPPARIRHKRIPKTGRNPMPGSSG